MIKLKLLFGLLKFFWVPSFNKLNNIASMFTQCLHVFKLFFKNIDLVNLFSISITISELRYIKFDETIVKKKFDLTSTLISI